MLIVRKLHEAGLRSEHAYTAALASVGLSLASWVISMKAEQAGVERADRWGIFVGEWAPTFFGLGLALAQYESRSSSNAEGQLSSVFDRRTSEAG